MKNNVNIWRDENGVPHVEASNEFDMYWGQGYVHAADRGLQLLLMRILGKGRAAELLDASDDTVKIDMFFRRMNWSSQAQSQISELPERERRCLDSYCDGVNAAFSRKYPWEFKLLGYRPEAWTGEDVVLMSRMIGYLTLVQSQAEMERLLIELVQAGVSREKLEVLFPATLGELDYELLQKVTLVERIVPSELLWQTAVPRMMASNNWAISGKRTASGKPIICNDPHLETNRLPNIWCEVVLKSGDRYLMGGSMPGIPGILSGRTPDLAWTATYSFLDAVDSWVEKCEGGKYYRAAGSKWLNFQTRKETIKRKKKSAVEVVFYENEHGVLEGNPNESGFYLATRWAAGESGAVSLCATLGMFDVVSVEEGMDTLGKVETGWNFVFADTNGELGYQMSGLAPRRREGVSGFVPLPGWKQENDWLGFWNHESLPRVKNPEEGFFATANQDLNRYGRAAVINMPMGSYRADRIAHLLANGNAFVESDMFAMHFDVYSLQAEYFMEILRPLLPDTPQGKLLQDWDLKYDAGSQGAFLFEVFYEALLCEVFGKNGLGESVVEYLGGETGTFADFYANFDRVLLAEESIWFGEKSRDEIYRHVAEEALQVEAKNWGQVRQFTMSNILFGGKLPAFAGFDRGPLTCIGNRATIHQGQIYRSAGRVTSFMPSFRTVVDLANNHLLTNLAGGPSDRRFSKWYCSDVNNWIQGKYKKVTADSEQGKIPF